MFDYIFGLVWLRWMLEWLVAAPLIVISSCRAFYLLTKDWHTEYPDGRKHFVITLIVLVGSIGMAVAAAVMNPGDLLVDTLVAAFLVIVFCRIVFVTVLCALGLRAVRTMYYVEEIAENTRH